MTIHTGLKEAAQVNLSKFIFFNSEKDIIRFTFQGEAHAVFTLTLDMFRQATFGAELTHTIYVTLGNQTLQR